LGCIYIFLRFASRQLAESPYSSSFYLPHFKKPEDMGMLKEFKSFAMKGSVIDLAVGVVIGTAFGKIVSSLVDDVITPLILSPALKAANFSNISDLKIGSVKYGSFLSAAISFVIIAFTLFLIIKVINKVMAKNEEAPTAPAEDVVLLREIRDALKK
jgi:large conductance mechanosensitive channel